MLPLNPQLMFVKSKLGLHLSSTIVPPNLVKNDLIGIPGEGDNQSTTLNGQTRPDRKTPVSGRDRFNKHRL